MWSLTQYFNLQEGIIFFNIGLNVILCENKKITLVSEVYYSTSVTSKNLNMTLEEHNFGHGIKNHMV